MRWALLAAAVAAAGAAEGQGRDALAGDGDIVGGCGAPILGMNLEHCRASRRVHGHLEGMGNVMRKLQCEDGGGLQVYAYGGSISAGSNSWCWADAHSEKTPYRSIYDQYREVCESDIDTRRNAATCREATWTRMLEKRLNEEFPCPKPHTVNGDLRAGMGTSHHLQDLEQCAAANFVPHRGMYGVHCEVLGVADLIISETVTNDKNPKLMAELMARRLLRLPSAPALYWLVGRYGNRFTIRPSKREPPYVDGSDPEAQSEMLEYYNLPQVSMLEAFRGDVDTLAKQERRHFDFSCDRKHPSIGGHSILAELMIFNIRRDIADVALAPALGEVSGPVPRKTLRAPWSTDAALEDSMDLIAEDLEEETLGDVMVSSSGFELQEDVAGKPGLIATSAGASVVLRPPGVAPAYAVCFFDLGYLISYQHMGVMEISVHVPKEGAQGCEADDMDGEAVFVTSLDTLRPDDHVSILEQRRISFAIPEGAACSWLKVTVVEAQPEAREENKIKLLTVGSVCPTDGVPFN